MTKHADAPVTLVHTSRPVDAVSPLRPAHSDPELWPRNPERPNIGAASRSAFGLLAVVVAGTLGVGHWTLTGDAQASAAEDDSSDGLILWVGCEEGCRNPHRRRARRVEVEGRRRLRLQRRAPAGPGRQPGLHREPRGELELEQLPAAASAARLQRGRTGGGAGNEDVPRRQAHQLLQPVDAAAGLVRSPGLESQGAAEARRRGRRREAARLRRNRLRSGDVPTEGRRG